MIDKCPSCGGELQALKNGRFFCEACDAIFGITREGPKVEKLAPLEQLERRVSALEGRTSGHSPGPESPEGVPGPETGDSDIDDEQDDEQDGEEDDNDKDEDLWPK